MTANHYTWTCRQRRDSPVTRAELYRDDTYIGVIDLEPVLPFHTSILQRLCDALHAEELANRADTVVDLTARHQLRAVAEFADTVQRRREAGT